MSIKNYELTDFFRQLSLLVKSGLPLPESLHNIAQNSSKREFRRTINDIVEQVANQPVRRVQGGIFPAPA